VKIKDKDLRDLIKKIDNLDDFFKSQDQRSVNVSQMPIFTSGPFLHEDTGLLSKEESLKIEQDNPELFAFRRSLNDEIRGILK